MKGFINRTYYNPKYAKAIQWGKLVTITGTGQVIAQLINLVCGILIIHLLSTKEYALYTLVNIMLGTITILSDAGIASGITAQGGKVWQDREKLGSIINTGLKLRKKFSVVTLAFAIPALTYLLIHHGASWLTTLLIVLSLIPAFFAALSDTLLEIGPKLKQDIGPAQKNGLIANVGRLLLTVASVIFFPYAYIAILASGLPRMWANIQLRKVSSGYVDFSQSPSKETESKVLALVKRTLPNAIYFCLSSQIISWLISILGTTNAVAQVGALNRLGMLLGLFSALFTTLISPRYARLTTKAELLQRYIQIHIGLLLFGIGVIAAVWMFPSQFLWILGKEYSNLQTELLLSMAGTVLILISSLSFSIYTSRGWAINPIIIIPVNIATIALGILLFNISTLEGVLWFNIYLAVIQVVINSGFGFIKIMKEHEIVTN